MKHAQWSIPALAILLAGRASAEDEPREAEASHALSRAGFGAAAGYGGPLGATVTAEFLYGFAGADVRDDGDRVKALGGVLFQVQGGPRGGKLSLGVGARARVEADDTKVNAGAAVKLSLARLWEAPERRGLTYLGPELDLSVWHLDLTLGPLWRVGGTGGSLLIFSWGVGLRL